MKNNPLMKTETENIISEKNIELKNIVDSFKDIFEDLTFDASRSSELLTINMKDSFSSEIDKLLKNPLEMNFNALIAIENSLYSLLCDFVEQFLSKHKNIIKHIYKVKKSGNVLHYSILFNQNTDIYILYPFLSQYQTSRYNSKFPLIFQDIPGELENQFIEEMTENKNFEKVEL